MPLQLGRVSVWGIVVASVVLPAALLEVSVVWAVVVLPGARHRSSSTRGGMA